MWKSFQTRPVPQWLPEAKFGILICWGPYSVPAYDNEWYFRNMYLEDHPVYRHHREKYGDPSGFGYKDFFPLFRAERFNPEEWAALMAEAGARFGGLAAEHADGFSMWASRINRWNAMDMGPRRNIAAELASALEKRGLKVVLSFHHSSNLLPNTFPAKAGWDTADPQYADLYGKFLDPVVGFERWLVKIQEAVEACSPDMVLFESGLEGIPDSYKSRLAAFFSGQQEPFVLAGLPQDFSAGAGIPILEPARIQTIQPSLWLAVDSIGTDSRCFTESLHLKSPRELIYQMIDVVSKKGVWLLTISPRADGTIPSDQQQILSEIGRWLRVNGAAVYSTRPWDFYGEGGVSPGLDETASVLRFTADDRALYIIIFGWPQSPLRPRSLQVRASDSRSQVTLLGLSDSLTFRVDRNRRLEIDVPDLPPSQRPCQYAYVFKLEGFDIQADPFYGPDALVLEAAAALLEGERLHRREQSGLPRIIWEDPQEKIHWLVSVRKAGRYAVRLEGSAAIGPVSLMLSWSSERLQFVFPRTEGWETLRFAEAGTIRFPRAGVYHLTLQAGDLKNWRPVNLGRIRLAPQ
ncbi:MAG: alpha-L-fucosidase [Anaerohalosphaeraceae bacterium]